MQDLRCRLLGRKHRRLGQRLWKLLPPRLNDAKGFELIGAERVGSCTDIHLHGVARATELVEGVHGLV